MNWWRILTVVNSALIAYLITAQPKEPVEVDTGDLLASIDSAEVAILNLMEEYDAKAYVYGENVYDRKFFKKLDTLNYIRRKHQNQFLAKTARVDEGISIRTK